jgi:hypothetical protein
MYSTIKEFLANFDIKKYEDTSNLELDEWFLNLSRRHGLIEKIEYRKSKIISFDEQLTDEDERIAFIGEKDRTEKEIESSLDKLLLNPIIKRGRYKIVPNVNPEQITDFSYADIICLMRFLRASHKEDFAIIEEIIHYDGDDFDDWLHAVHGSEFYLKKIKSLDLNGYKEPVGHYVGFNLSAPNDQTLKNIKKWLKGEKKSADYYRQLSGFTENTLKDWNNYQILPYLDIYIWQQVSGEKITYADITDKLYPNSHAEIDLVYRCENTINKTALKLMTHSYMSALGAQVAIK